MTVLNRSSPLRMSNELVTNDIDQLDLVLPGGP